MTAKEVIEKKIVELKELVGRTIVAVDGVITYDDQIIPYFDLDNGKRVYIHADESLDKAGYLDIEGVAK